MSLKGVNEGEWSVFAEKVVRERDAAHQEVKRLRDRMNELESPLSYLPPSEERAKAVAAIERAKSETYREESARLNEQLASAVKDLEASVGALQAYYHACKCQHDAMDAVNVAAYAVIQKAGRR